MNLPRREELSKAAATVIAFGHCGKLMEGLPAPQVKHGLEEVVELVRRAESAEIVFDGYGSGGWLEIRSPDDPERLTALEAHMERVMEGKHPTDEVRNLAASAAADLIEAGRSLRAFGHKLELARTLSTPRRPNAHTEAICAEPTCEDPAVPGHDGRCRNDYQWRWQYRQDHPGEVPPPVPEKTIATRKERTEKRRQHVTGPYAETEMGA